MVGFTGVAIGSGTVDNAGTIRGTGLGVSLNGAGATLVNRAGALISGQFGGVTGYDATVINAGTIDGPSGYGIQFQVGANSFVSNSASGLIQGYSGGIQTIGTVINAGTIQANNTVVGQITNGIYLAGSQATLVNRPGGLVEGVYGVIAYIGAGANTITNYGTIVGTGGTAVRLRSSSDVMVVEAGTMLIGTVAGDRGTLAFGGTGTESGIGSATLTGSAPGTFVGFSTYLVQAGANWTFAEPSTIGIDKTIVDAGMLTVSGTLAAAGRLTVSGSLVNDGTIGGGGITLSAGGQVTNETNATISAPGIALYGAPGIGVTATNYGVILAQTYGVQFRGSGDVINATGALISGQDGVVSTMLDNAGTILGTELGVVSPITGGIESALSVFNRTGALISGRFYGVEGIGTVVNAGTITSSDGDGVYLPDLAGDGFVSNSAGGLIQGVPDGIFIGGTVDNAGTILATYQRGYAPGVYLTANGAVINRSGGVIQGQIGISERGAGRYTVTNYGTIIGNTGTAVLLPSINGVLEVEAGSTLVGSAVGGGGTLALGAGGGAGTISGFGTGASYRGFGHYQVNAGADWTFSGTNTIASGDTLSVAGTLVVTGTVSIATGALLTAGGPITVNGGVLIDQTSLGGANPTIDITGNGTVALLGTPPAGAAVVDFTGPGVLTLANVNGVTIKDFKAGDAIGVTAAVYQPGASATYSPSSHALTLTSGASQFVLQTENFTLTPGDHLTVVNNAGHAQIEEIPCFLRGTRILTQLGEVAVEDLTAGEMVVTLSGEVRPIVWIGTGRVCVRPGQRGAATPIRVRKGALADNVPHRDLLITKGHSLFVDGVLIPAEYLVNHRSILWDDDARTVEYYHIELAAHDVLLADGAAAESYRDDGNRGLFANANSFWGQPPKPPCAPVLTGGPIVDAAWRRLLDRAGGGGETALTQEADLHLLADGERVDGLCRTDGRYVFNLPRHPHEVRVVSRAGSPAELGLARDPRRLGVAVRQIRLWHGARLRVLDASDPLLADGFHGFEADNGFRWTDGDASVPAALFAGSDGACELELLVTGSTQYPRRANAISRQPRTQASPHA
jgi:hypothetical protein